MLFMSSPSNTVKLDALREHGAHALTLYASHHPACTQAAAPSITVETVPSANAMFTPPKPDDVVEFNYQHFFKSE
jgi:hypothetical protein